MKLKRRICAIIISVLMFFQICGGAFAQSAYGLNSSSYSNYKEDIQNEDIQNNEEFSITLLDGKTLNEIEFINYLNEHTDEIIKISDNKNHNNKHKSRTKRSLVEIAEFGVAVEGTWYIPGLGEAVIAGGVLYLGGKTIYNISSWAYKATVKFFENREKEKNEKNNNHWGRQSTLKRHFNDHGKDFGSSSPEDYAKEAHDFYKKRGKHKVKVRSNGVIQVYDPDKNIFGSYNPDGTTKTYFRPSGKSKYWDRQPGK